MGGYPDLFAAGLRGFRLLPHALGPSNSSASSAAVEKKVVKQKTVVLQVLRFTRFLTPLVLDAAGGISSTKVRR